MVPSSDVAACTLPLALPAKAITWAAFMGTPYPLPLEVPGVFRGELDERPDPECVFWNVVG